MMKKLTVALVLLTLISIGCSRFTADGRHRGGRGHTATFTAGNEGELNEAVQRVNEFKRELITAGLREEGQGVTTTPAGGSRRTFTLKGDYGKLHDLEVTLWTSDKLDPNMDNHHIGVGAQCQISNESEDKEFDALTEKLRLVATGSSSVEQK